MYPRRRRIHPAVTTIGTILIVTILIWLLGRLDIFGWAMRGIAGMFSEGRETGYTSDEIRHFRETIGNLESENATLKETVRRLSGEEALEELENQIGHTLLPGQVIYRDHSRIFDTAIINRGTADGVEIGMPVVSVDGLVGRVVASRSAVSRIQLLTSPDCSFGVIDQRSRELGVVRGSDMTQWTFGAPTDNTDDPAPQILILEYLSPSADISLQDTLITSGLSGITPSGIRVGKVVSILRMEEQGWFDIQVEPFADFEHLETIAVVLFTEEEQQEIEEVMDLLDETEGEIGPPLAE